MPIEIFDPQVKFWCSLPNGGYMAIPQKGIAATCPSCGSVFLFPEGELVEGPCGHCGKPFVEERNDNEV